MKTTTEWEKEYKRILVEFRAHPENQVSLKYGTKFVNDFHKLLQKALTTQRNELLDEMEEIIEDDEPYENRNRHNEDYYLEENQQINTRNDLRKQQREKLATLREKI